MSLPLLLLLGASLFGAWLAGPSLARAEEVPPEIARLLHDLRDDDIPGNAQSAERALVKKGRAAWPYLIDALDSPDAQQRRFAARIAMTIAVVAPRPSPYDVPDRLLDLSVRALYHVKWHRGLHRDESIQQLAQFHRRYWSRCAPRLERALADPDERIRTWAAVLLVHYSPESFEFSLLAVKRLFDGLIGTARFHAADHCVRALHARAIPQTRALVQAKYGGDHAHYLASLVLADVDDPVDVTTGDGAEESAEAPVRALIEVAIDGLADDEIPWNNEENRTRLTAWGVTALPYVEAAFSSQDRLQQQSCIGVAQSIVEEHELEPSPLLLRMSVDSLRHDDVSWNAHGSQSFLTKYASDSLSALEGGLSSPDVQQRFLSALVLATTQQTRSMRGAIATLVEFLDDNEVEGDAMWSCYALHAFGKPAIPILETYLTTAGGQRRRALELVLGDLRSESPPDAWKWYEEKFEKHGLSSNNADPCVRTPSLWPSFRGRGQRPAEAYLSGKHRIPPLEKLLRDHGRAGVDHKLGGLYGQVLVTFGRRVGRDTVWVVRVREIRVWPKPTQIQWQLVEASPMADPWNVCE